MTPHLSTRQLAVIVAPLDSVNCDLPGTASYCEFWQVLALTTQFVGSGQIFTVGIAVGDDEGSAVGVVGVSVGCVVGVLGTGVGAVVGVATVNAMVA